MSTGPAPTPTPTTLTLRFKHHKSTTLLVAEPLTSFTALKAELLRALRQTHPSGRLQSSSSPLPPSSAAFASSSSTAESQPGIPIPTSPADVLLARPKDPLDASAGWIPLITSAEEAAASTTGDAAVMETPKAAGLKDGAVLAFRFRGEGPGAARSRRGAGGGDGDVDEGVGMDDDEDEDEVLDEEDADGDGGWDVVLPSYEDAAGVVNEGDVGALRNYNG